MKKIYLACPYSSISESERIFRANVASRIAGKLMLQGHAVFSPISHGHAIAETNSKVGTKHEAWSSINHAMIAWSTEVYVLTLPGAKDSSGINNDELPLAKKLNKPITFVQPDNV